MRLKKLFKAFSIVLIINGVMSQDEEDDEVNVVQDTTAMIPTGILNFAEINWPFIFDSLVSPKVRFNLTKFFDFSKFIVHLFF